MRIDFWKAPAERRLKVEVATLEKRVVELAEALRGHHPDEQSAAHCAICNSANPTEGKEREA